MERVVYANDATQGAFLTLFQRLGLVSDEYEEATVLFYSSILTPGTNSAT